MLNILVVDDSLIIRKNLRRMLEELGHKVVAEAKNGIEAIAMYKKSLPALVTMDITMPEMDGIEVVKLIRAECQDAKIIMITSHGQEEKVIDSVRAGASGYLLKPITIDRLVAAIGKVFPEYARDDSFIDDADAENGGDTASDA